MSYSVWSVASVQRELRWQDVTSKWFFSKVENRWPFGFITDITNQISLSAGLNTQFLLLDCCFIIRFIISFIIQHWHESVSCQQRSLAGPSCGHDSSRTSDPWSLIGCLSCPGQHSVGGSLCGRPSVSPGHLVPHRLQRRALRWGGRAAPHRQGDKRTHWWVSWHLLKCQRGSGSVKMESPSGSVRYSEYSLSLYDSFCALVVYILCSKLSFSFCNDSLTFVTRHFFNEWISWKLFKLIFN